MSKVSSEPLHPDVGVSLMRLTDVLLDNYSVDGMMTVVKIANELITMGATDANLQEYYSYVSIQDYAYDVAQAMRRGLPVAEIRANYPKPKSDCFAGDGKNPGDICRQK